PRRSVLRREPDDLENYADCRTARGVHRRLCRGEPVPGDVETQPGQIAYYKRRPTERGAARRHRALWRQWLDAGADRYQGAAEIGPRGACLREIRRQGLPD